MRDDHKVTAEEGSWSLNIEFFSRDDTGSGMNLEFGYDLVNGAWYHDGKNSRGEPLFEIWEQRSGLGSEERRTNQYPEAHGGEPAIRKNLKGLSSSVATFACTTPQLHFYGTTTGE